MPDTNLPLTSMSRFSPFLFQCIEGSGTPRGGEHCNIAGSPAATRVSCGSILNSSLRTVNNSWL